MSRFHQNHTRINPNNTCCKEATLLWGIFQEQSQTETQYVTKHFPNSCMIKVPAAATLVCFLVFQPVQNHFSCSFDRHKNKRAPHSRPQQENKQKRTVKHKKQVTWLRFLARSVPVWRDRPCPGPVSKAAAVVLKREGWLVSQFLIFLLHCPSLNITDKHTSQEHIRHIE